MFTLQKHKSFYDSAFLIYDKNVKDIFVHLSLKDRNVSNPAYKCSSSSNLEQVLTKYKEMNESNENNFYL